MMQVGPGGQPMMQMAPGGQPMQQMQPMMAPQQTVNNQTTVVCQPAAVTPVKITIPELLSN